MFHDCLRKFEGSTVLTHYYPSVKKGWDTYQQATALELGRATTCLLAFEAEAEMQPILALHRLYSHLLIPRQQ